MTKTCKGCLETKEIGRFYKHPKMADGRLSFCAVCTRARVRSHYTRTRPARAAYERERYKRPERKAAAAASLKRHAERHPEKVKARMAVSNAIRDGRLIKQPCQRCGTTERIQAHHHDYSKPLDVEWLCFKCHREEHGQTVIAA